jgi:hypothetical protein
MNNSEDKIEFNYTVILDPLGREFDAAAFTQDELSMMLALGIKDAANEVVVS